MGVEVGEVQENIWKLKNLAIIGEHVWDFWKISNGNRPSESKQVSLTEDLKLLRLFIDPQILFSTYKLNLTVSKAAKQQDHRVVSVLTSTSSSEFKIHQNPSISPNFLRNFRIPRWALAAETTNFQLISRFDTC